MALGLAEFVLDYWTAFWVSGAAVAVLFLVFMLFHQIRVRRLQQTQFDLRVLVEQKSHSEGRYRELFDNATDAVFVTDLDGNITQLNRKAEALIGYEGAEARAQNLRVFLPDTETGERVLQQWLSGEADASEQIEITSRTGE